MEKDSGKNENAVFPMSLQGCASSTFQSSPPLFALLFLFTISLLLSFASLNSLYLSPKRGRRRLVAPMPFDVAAKEAAPTDRDAGTQRT